MRALAVLLLLAACDTPEQADPAPATEQATAPFDSRAQYDALQSAREAGDAAEALRLAREGLERTEDKRAKQAFGRAVSELEVVGVKAGDPGVTDWFVGEYDPEAPAQLWVFWEVWCPHCRREMPELQALHQQKGDALEIVGLTRLSKDTTPEKARAFIEENGLTYPIGRTTQEVAARLNISGVPAAALIVDGEVAWRGHPGALDAASLDALLN